MTHQTTRAGSLMEALDGSPSFGAGARREPSRFSESAGNLNEDAKRKRELGALEKAGFEQQRDRHALKTDTYAHPSGAKVELGKVNNLVTNADGSATAAIDRGKIGNLRTALKDAQSNKLVDPTAGQVQTLRETLNAAAAAAYDLRTSSVAGDDLKKAAADVEKDIKSAIRAASSIR